MIFEIQHQVFIIREFAKGFRPVDVRRSFLRAFGDGENDVFRKLQPIQFKRVDNLFEKNGIAMTRKGGSSKKKQLLRNIPRFWSILLKIPQIP